MCLSIKYLPKDFTIFADLTSIADQLSFSVFWPTISCCNFNIFFAFKTTKVYLKLYKMASSSSTLAPVSPPRFRQRFVSTMGGPDLRDRYSNGTIIHNRVFIGGLHHSVTENLLEQKFGCYGKISDIKIIRKPEMEKGYAFITFEKQEDASKVLEHSGAKVKLNGVESKIGPAIRKPSPNEHSGCIGKVDGASYVLKSLGTSPNKRGRLVSSPATLGVETSAVAAGLLNSVPIPVPMPKNANQESGQKVNFVRWNFEKGCRFK